MLCGFSRGKADEFAFSSRGYSLSNVIVSEYKNVKDLYRRAESLLSAYEEKRPDDRKKCVSVILRSLELYEKSEKLVSLLLTEILKPKADIRHKKSVFDLLNKLAKILYLFDISRFSKVAAFHDFALLKQSGAAGLSENKILRLTSFAAISMPMAQLFLSSFTSNRLELHMPTILFKRNLLHLDSDRRKAMHFVCSVLRDTDLRYLAIYFCAAYNRFFRSRDFDRFVRALDEQHRSYYDTMLLLN